jgi:hypothetical protein
VAAKLEAIAKDKKIEKVPLTVCKDGVKGPGDYSIGKDAALVVVVYDATMTITAHLSFDKLDAKAADAAVQAFEKMLASVKEEKQDKDGEKKDEKK